MRTFCDIVWLEIWNDVAPMSDHAQYRRIITELFIECKQPWEITYTTTDDKGKKITKRLGTRPVTGGTGSAIADARALLAKLGKGVSVDTKRFVEQVNAAKEAAGVASPPSG